MPRLVAMPTAFSFLFPLLGLVLPAFRGVHCQKTPQVHEVDTRDFIADVLKEDEEMDMLSFATSASVKFDAEPLKEGLPPKEWNLQEHRQTLTTEFKSGFAKKVDVNMLERVLEPEEVSSILSTIEEEGDLSRAGDYIDNLPSHMVRLGPLDCGSFCPKNSTREKLVNLITPIVQTRLMPYIKHRYKCKKCMVCNIALRKYAPELGQRFTLPTHYDEGYFVSAELGLDVQGLEYDGGLYVEDGKLPAKTRKIVPLKTGDAFFHKYDLAHGVRVTEGRRTMLLVQFHDAEDCQPDYTRWYKKDAKKGDPVATFHLGQLYQVGTTKSPKNTTRAASLLVDAVKGGFARGSTALAEVLLHVDPSNKEAASEVLREASSNGDADATYALARFLMENPRSKENEAEAKKLMIRAAEPPMSLPIAQQMLGNLYLDGELVEKDMKKAVEWWGMAGVQGVPPAQSNVGSYFLNQALDMIEKKVARNKIDKKLVEAEKWLRPSAAAGYGGAMYSLGVLLLRGHNKIDEALRWLEKAKDTGHEQAVAEFEGVRQVRVAAEKKKAKERAFRVIV